MHRFENPEELWLDYIYQWNPLMAEVDAAESCFILNSFGLKKCVKLYNEFLFPVEEAVFKNELSILEEDDRTKAITCIRILNKCAVLKREYNMQQELDESETKSLRRFSQTINRRERGHPRCHLSKPSPLANNLPAHSHHLDNNEFGVALPKYLSDILGHSTSNGGLNEPNIDRSKNSSESANGKNPDDVLSRDSNSFGDVAKYKIISRFDHVTSGESDRKMNGAETGEKKGVVIADRHADDSPFGAVSRSDIATSPNSAGCSRSNSGYSRSNSLGSNSAGYSRRSVPGLGTRHAPIPEDSILDDREASKAGGEIIAFKIEGDKIIRQSNGDGIFVRQSSSCYSLSLPRDSPSRMLSNCVSDIKAKANGEVADDDAAMMMRRKKVPDGDDAAIMMRRKKVLDDDDAAASKMKELGRAGKKGVLDRLRSSLGSLGRGGNNGGSLRRSFNRKIRKQDIGQPTIVASQETTNKMEELGCVGLDQLVSNNGGMRADSRSAADCVQTSSVGVCKIRTGDNENAFPESFFPNRSFPNGSFPHYATMGRDARHENRNRKSNNEPATVVSETSNVLELDSILNGLYEDILRLDGSISALSDPISADDSVFPAGKVNVFEGVSAATAATAATTATAANAVTAANAATETTAAIAATAATEDSEPDGDWIYPNEKERRDSGVGASLTRTFSKGYERIRRESLTRNCCAQTSVDELSVDELTSLKRTCLLKISEALTEYVPSKHSNWFKTPKNRRSKNSAPVKGEIFGRSLGELQIKFGQPLPPPITRLMRMLRRQAADCDGIFRKAGLKPRVLALKEELDANLESLFLDDIPLYDIADLVKLFFRELPECLLTNVVSKVLIDFFQNAPEEKRNKLIKFSVIILPDENREALQSLLHFLHDLSKMASHTQMNANNLAVCFCPSLFNIWTKTCSDLKMKDAQLRRQKIAHQCLTYMINNAQQLFLADDDLLKLSRPTKPPRAKVTIEADEFQTYFQSNIPIILKLAKKKKVPTATLR